MSRPIHFIHKNIIKLSTGGQDLSKVPSNTLATFLQHRYGYKKNSIKSYEIPTDSLYSPISTKMDIKSENDCES